MAMELRALFLLPLCFPALQGQTPEVQRRREGDTLSIECPYTAEPGEWHVKYWCRQTNGGCQEIARTYYESRQQSEDGRTKIKDDATRKTVSINMTDLKAEDSGTYSCLVHKSYYNREQLRTISLNVFKELLRWELDTLSVQCPRRSGMAWCRAEQADCAILVQRKSSSKQSEGKSLQERASIKNNAQGSLTVTMEKLQTWDSGVYWCAQGSEHTRITEVVLSVFKRTQQLTAEASGNVSVQCHYKSSDYGAVSKAWCKKEEGETCKVLATSSPEPAEGHSPARGGVRVQDEAQQGTVTVTMEQLQEQDSGVYWCALRERSGLARIEEVTLSVLRASSPGGFPDHESKNQEILLGDSPDASGNTFVVLSVVLLVLLLLALLTSTALGVRHYKLLARAAGNRPAEDTSDRAEGTAQPGSTGRRKSSQDDSKGSAYINLEVQSHPSPEDPLYCNVEPSQAPRNPQHVEYAVIAFSQSPRNGRE